MIHGVSATNHSLVAAKNLPSSANARFKCSPIHLNPGTRAHLRARLECSSAPVTRNQPLIARGGWNEIGDPASGFRNRSRHCPSQAQVDCQVSGDPPIVLDKRAVDLPASARNIPGQILIVNALMLYLVSGIVHCFHVHGFWSAFFGAMIISFVSWLFSAFFRGSDGRIYVITHHSQIKPVQGRVIE